ncbi:hypothetical protein C7M84_013225 [Penaeus vannamei]|uniref:ZP domain-containing protein n=1 Tax=Penaeus vannamei TaxID=6689 RepID=A0A423SWQ2_PENVA|nr:uncharacterized protein LOC113815913 [Penaeus vannamei]ROT68612.1 hypothetical protein C7M84_013225 [Penaeus vannamei]
MCGEVDAWKIKTVLVSILVASACAADWKEDLSNELSIGVSDKGYARAVLDCEDDHMAFVITMEEDFEGVVYTRGSFHARKGPCFLDATGGKEFALKFSNKDCGTKYDSALGAHVNTVVVQHDDDLIFPGDLAFALRCHDQVTVSASMEGVKSKITLVDPDPGAKEDSKDELSATSSSRVVTLSPARPSPPKEEL